MLHAQWLVLARPAMRTTPKAIIQSLSRFQTGFFILVSVLLKATECAMRSITFVNFFFRPELAHVITGPPRSRSNAYFQNKNEVFILG